MTERRQMWAGLTWFALLLGLARAASAIGLLSLGSQGFAVQGLAVQGLGAATLVATTMLIAVCLTRQIAVPPVAVRVRPVVGTREAIAPTPIRSSDPDSPGAARPRAPGRGHSARPI